MKYFHISTALISILTLFYPKISNAQIRNFDKNGGQIIRFDKAGNAVDAHDGEIALFNGTYYLYGTSYDCGFEWQNNTAPFCGFKSYSSKDMITWKDEGFLFNAQNQVWQSRCDGKTYGCFRPHVIYNKKNKIYVLWINVYDNVSGYRVFIGESPVGPFSEVAEPKIAVNSTMPAAGLNNGDHDLFIDDDGKGYLAITDWRKGGKIVIEQLTDDYLSGNGNVADSVTSGKTEAPALFKRNGIYYVTYSDPNCGYCSGTGTSYKTAKSPLGPWSEGKKISDNSCGGQPSFVSTMKINSETVYLYGSDLWNNAAKNEALANYYWAPLSFAADGSINPLNCFEIYKFPKASPSSWNSDKQNTPGSNSFRPICDISDSVQRSQSFTAKNTGLLTKVDVAIFKNKNPVNDLVVEIYTADRNFLAVGKSLYSHKIPAGAIGWSPKRISIMPNISVTKSSNYAIVFKTATTKGCYGVAISDTDSISGSAASISVDGGKSFERDVTRILKFETFTKALKR